MNECMNECNTRIFNETYINFVSIFEEFVCKGHSINTFFICPVLSRMPQFVRAFQWRIKDLAKRRPKTIYHEADQRKNTGKIKP